MTATAVLWDMDGTLIDSEHVAVAALQRAMSEAGLPVLPDLLQLAMGRAADDLYRWLVHDYGLASDPVSWERRKHFHHFAAADALKGFNPAVELFLRLEKLGVPQAIVSNSDRAIMDLQLRLAGLDRPGRISVARNDVRVGKPNPEGYLRAAWLLGVDADQCLVVEDSRSGAEAGIAAGMHTLFVPHAQSPAPAGTTPIAAMDDLMNMVSLPHP